jgi:hypothetical protein
MRTAIALLLLLAGAPLAAQDDPLKSPACGAALSQLQAARAAGQADANIAQLRGAAATACLGSSATPARPARVLQAPVRVPPPQVEVPQGPAPLPALEPPPPPVAVQRLPAPATCDASGCWTSDGTHLRHVAPSLAGPQGLCTVHGGLVHCP